ncbi:MAG TPA: carbohydrate ABC transporter permease [Candidatus Limnocylindrales bacterium]|nr:carbohydrate ABC transporter permease [Candidatus Limnocylindrales bacterium]
MSRRSPRARLAEAVRLLGLAIVALAWALPLIWTLAVSFHPPDEPLSASNLWFGSQPTLANYGQAFDIAPFAQYYINTIIIVGGILVVQLITISLAGYAFARFRFRGQNLLFFLILLQLLVPSSALIVPNYATIRSLHLFDTLVAVMLPFFGSAFGAFLMRQTFKTVPQDLDDAARVDGASWWQTLWHVYLPPARPAMIAFALSSISFHWNDFLWPLVVTNSQASRPLTVGLAVFTQLGEIGAQWPLVTAGTIIVVGPLLVLFLLFQRQFVESFLHTGLK